MAIQFPSDAINNTPYTDPGTGYIYDWDGQKWNGRVSSGAGSTPISVGDTPPSGATVGDLWWNSDDGRLYIYYNDGDTLQWVDASPPGAGSDGGGSGGIGSLQEVTDVGNTTTNWIRVGDFDSTSATNSGSVVDVGTLWAQRPYSATMGCLNIWGGTTETAIIYSDGGVSFGEGNFTINADGDVKIGGTLPASPNIELNANGSSNFAGFVTTNGVTVNKPGTGTVEVGGLSTVWGLQVSDDAGTRTGGIKYDGSAEFKGDVFVTGLNTFANGAVNLAESYSKAAFRVTPASNSSNCINIGPEGTGSNMYLQGSNNPGNAARDIYAQRFGGSIFLGDSKTELKSDGSATFGKDVLVAGTQGFTSRIKADGRIELKTNQPYLACTDANDAEKIVLQNDGSASFANSVTSGPAWDRTANQDTTWIPKGEIYLQRASGEGGQPLLRGHLSSNDGSNSTITSEIKADGSAEFKGRLTAGQTNVATDSHFLTNKIDIDAAKPTNAAAYIQNYGTAPSLIVESKQSSTAIQVTGNTPSLQKAVEIKGDGTADFAGNIQTGTWNGTTGSGTTVGAGGTLGVRPATDNSDNVLSVIPTDTASLNAAIRADGSASFAGKITLAGTSPAGIQFGDGGIGDNVPSQTLDDYEEGTWTPVIASTNTGLTLTMGTLVNSIYTKVGNIVTIQCRMALDSSDNLQDCQIGDRITLDPTSLPFASVGIGMHGSMINYVDNTTPTRAAIFNLSQNQLSFICVYKEGQVAYSGNFDFSFTYHAA